MMMKNRFATYFLAFMSLAILSGCDLAQNHLKIDRERNLEVQDYRDALAQREVEPRPQPSNADIPAFQDYIATSSDQLKPMPLVSLSVNQTVPLRDVLFELASQADYDIELDPRIRGSIIFTARNRPFDVVIDKISETAGLRYRFEDDSLRIELDTPYHKNYKINYINFIRSNNSSIRNNVAVVSGDGADTGSAFESTGTSEIDFWTELQSNLEQILDVNREASTLRTSRDPRITAVEQNPAPVEPIIIDEEGELSENGQESSAVSPPEAVLRIDSLPVDDEETGTGGIPGQPGNDPFAPRFSINKQGGIISVFASERLHKQIEEYLFEVKKSVTSQVLIEAKVFEVSLSDEFAAGINWGSLDFVSDELSLGFGSGLSNLARASLPNPAVNPSGTNFNIGLVGNDFFGSADLLSRFGTVKALASPRLTVLNNQSAVLNVASNQIYFEIDIDVTQNDNTTTTDIDSEIRNVPEGVLINVQPSIDLDNQTISMAVRPTVTRIVEFVNDPAVDFSVAEAAAQITNQAIAQQVLEIQSLVPVVNVQELDSVIKMGTGEAIVMGGLLQDRTESTQNAVPVLGEIPMVGGLFRNQSDSIQKTELVIFIRATIVDAEGRTITAPDKDLYRTFSGDRRPLRL